VVEAAVRVLAHALQVVQNLHKDIIIVIIIIIIIIIIVMFIIVVAASGHQISARTRTCIRIKTV
jgi:threonine/homoserine/homoserine lactone efflux protein